MDKKKISLTSLIFMAICCDLAIMSKKLISPLANIVTEFLHIPGGISTTFALMFIIIGANLCEFVGCATLMCFVQSMIAIISGHTGSMGMMVIVSYVVPGIVIDLLMLCLKPFVKKRTAKAVALTNALSGVSAAVCANCITFRISGIPLLIYLLVAFTSGCIFGAVASIIIKRIYRSCHLGHDKEA